MFTGPEFTALPSVKELAGGCVLLASLLEESVE